MKITLYTVVQRNGWFILVNDDDIANFPLQNY